MSSYMDATFRPCAARPGVVTLLVPHLWNPGETLPVHVPQAQLVNVWMALVSSMNLGGMQQQIANYPAQPSVAAAW